MNALLAQESWLRLAAFASVFLIMALWESTRPRRARTRSKAYRWANNLGIIVVDTLLTRALFPTAAVGVALLAERAGWGLFNVLALPPLAAVLLSVVLLDFAIWLQHRAFHVVPVLWRLHRMHHADVDIDVTTGLRFHPLEIVLSMLIKIAVVVAFGVPAVAVLIFEVLLNATSMFNHSNVRLPTSIDAALRWILVTPDMHRVHHSWHERETNSNFGFNLSVWDRLFSTYIAQPRDGHEQMTIGLHEFRAVGDQRLDRMLLQPFLAGPDAR